MKSGIKVLYFFVDFGTLPLGAVATAAQRAGVARSLERMARAVRGLLQRTWRSAARFAAICSAC